jgi:hypothetical protein
MDREVHTSEKAVVQMGAGSLDFVTRHKVARDLLEGILEEKIKKYKKCLKPKYVKV